mmetsp:Transcript_99653/g.320977  ORF Transcript_99653/g.320977 Transcript_99653/m.320977 type:complete len:210 (-) Transcript_99653:3204-3833(-)
MALSRGCKSSTIQWEETAPLPIPSHRALHNLPPHVWRAHAARSGGLKPPSWPAATRPGTAAAGFAWSFLASSMILIAASFGGTPLLTSSANRAFNMACASPAAARAAAEAAARAAAGAAAGALPLASTTLIAASFGGTPLWTSSANRAFTMACTSAAAAGAAAGALPLAWSTIPVRGGTYPALGLTKPTICIPGRALQLGCKVPPWGLP